MEIRDFYKKFCSKFNRVKKEISKDIKNYYIGDSDWTAIIEEVIRSIFISEGKNCISKHKLGKLAPDDMKEFLSIDFSIFNTNEEYFAQDNISSWIMEYAIEHENKEDRIWYNLSKLLNLKARNKVFIGYVNQDRKEEVLEIIVNQIKNIKSDNFREDEKILIMLGHIGMTKSSEYEPRLIYLNSKQVRKKI